VRLRQWLLVHLPSEVPAESSRRRRDLWRERHIRAQSARRRL
jgi:hypothetical protein